ncbi:MAG: signal peptidase II [Planctomycetota bacterium]|nr:signal peptidase II [Planctomycetota bacterium]
MVQTEGGRWPWVRFLIVVVLVALDLWTKAAVFGWLEGENPPELVRDAHRHERFLVLGNWLALMTSLNEGAAFGGFKDWPHLLVGGRTVAVIVLLVALWRTKREHMLLLWGVVLVLAGASGNLYDNLFLDNGDPFGKVRDFIDVYFVFKDWHFPTFNVADSCITCGAACFLLYGLFHREEEQSENDEATPEQVHEVEA